MKKLNRSLGKQLSGMPSFGQKISRFQGTLNEYCDFNDSPPTVMVKVKVMVRVNVKKGVINE